MPSAFALGLGLKRSSMREIWSQRLNVTNGAVRTGAAACRRTEAEESVTGCFSARAWGEKAVSSVAIPAAQVNPASCRRLSEKVIVIDNRKLRPKFACRSVIGLDLRVEITGNAMPFHDGDFEPSAVVRETGIDRPFCSSLPWWETVSHAMGFKESEMDCLGLLL